MNDKLNKILPYCGYGLKYQGMGSNDLDGNPTIISFTGMELQDETWFFRGEEDHEDGEIVYHEVEGEVFQILFSPDCLTRESETEYGKEIPLVELWKICFDKDQLLDDYYFKTGEYDSRILCNGLVLVFNYCHGFYTIQHGAVYFAENQWQLFQYLHSRHIAFNLSPDEHVPVTDEFNPYKLK